MKNNTKRAMLKRAMSKRAKTGRAKTGRAKKGGTFNDNSRRGNDDTRRGRSPSKATIPGTRERSRDRVIDNTIFKPDKEPSNNDYLNAYKKASESSIQLDRITIRNAKQLLKEPYLTDKHLSILREMQKNPDSVKYFTNFGNIIEGIYQPRSHRHILGVSRVIGKTYYSIIEPRHVNITETEEGLYNDTIDVNNEDEIKSLEVIDDDGDKSYQMTYDLGDDEKVIRQEIRDCVINFKSYRPGVKWNSKSQIPIYIVNAIGKSTAHIAIIIICNNKQYSLGLGNVSGKIGNTLTQVAGLYSPDHVLSPTLYNDIVDIGILTEEHLMRIQKYVDCATDVTLVGNIDNSRMKIEQVLIELDSTKCPLYCKYSSSSIRTDRYVNCTSFVTSIFPNIDCNQGILIPVANPSKCKRYPPLPFQSIQDFFNNYFSPEVSADSFVNFLNEIKSYDM